jgi:hypothetical protein
MNKKKKKKDGGGKASRGRRGCGFVCGVLDLAKEWGVCRVLPGSVSLFRSGRVVGWFGGRQIREVGSGVGGWKKKKQQAKRGASVFLSFGRGG